MSLKTYQIHELAVLRGVCDGGDPGRYFGSFGAIDYWTSEAEISGLVVRHGMRFAATAEGERIFSEVLNDLPQCRQVFWSSDKLAAVTK
mgnify:FL=1